MSKLLDEERLTLVEELAFEKEHAQKRVAVDQATAQRAGVGSGFE